jgi:hypothetical protein
MGEALVLAGRVQLRDDTPEWHRVVQERFTIKGNDLEPPQRRPNLRHSEPEWSCSAERPCTSFKAELMDTVELVVDVRSDFSDAVIPTGTRGTVIERYEMPREGYAVDLLIHDDTLVGGFRYENVVLVPEQFSLVRK